MTPRAPCEMANFTGKSANWLVGSSLSKIRGYELWTISEILGTDLENLRRGKKVVMQIMNKSKKIRIKMHKKRQMNKAYVT